MPVELIWRIAGLKCGGAHKILGLLLKNKLLHHEQKKYDAYRLTFQGYDFLALKALSNRDAVTGFGKQIGAIAMPASCELGDACL